jgi:NitT/TauT family transport system substrate-binding protein
MMRVSLGTVAGAVAAWVVVVSALHLTINRAPALRGTAARTLQVGGLPVTCNLTLPIASVAMSRDAEGRTVVDVTLADAVAEYSKYSGWPELKESFMTGTVRAAYLLAPMVMDLVESGVAAKIVSLGHRSGAVIMVRTDSTVRLDRLVARS